MILTTEYKNKLEEILTKEIYDIYTEDRKSNGWINGQLPRKIDTKLCKFNKLMIEDLELFKKIAKHIIYCYENLNNTENIINNKDNIKDYSEKEKCNLCNNGYVITNNGKIKCNFCKGTGKIQNKGSKK